MLDISKEQKPNCSVVTLKGRLDAVTSPQFDKELQAVENNSPNSSILDMASVDYLSSAGLRSLLAGTKRLKAKQKNLVVCHLVPGVAEIIRVSGFDRIFTIAPSMEEALKLV